MNKEEIKQALEIIRQPITVNCQDYHYFDQENYNKLISVYDNCQWFINNFEQLMINLEEAQQKVNQLEEENKQLKERIEYYYEFDEYLKKEDLPEELRPYYKNQDCCRYIVELRKENKQLKDKVNQLETNRDEAIEYINKYAWQEDIIGDMYTTTGKPIVDRYMQLDWDSCNELLSLLERGKE